MADPKDTEATDETDAEVDDTEGNGLYRSQPPREGGDDTHGHERPGFY